MSNQEIYVMGGVNNNPLGASVPLKQNWHIDSTLNVVEKTPMTTPRYCFATAVIRDRFILAIGGLVGQNKESDSCECFDSLTNTWFAIEPLSEPCFNTTACVVVARYVYVMPGANQAAYDNGVAIIEYLDTGSSQDYFGDPKSATFGHVIGKKKWEQLSVINSEFISQKPTAAVVYQSSILIFGGDGTKNFTMNPADVINGSRKIEVRTVKGSNLKQKGTFSLNCDFVGK